MTASLHSLVVSLSGVVLGLGGLPLGPAALAQTEPPASDVPAAGTEPATDTSTTADPARFSCQLNNGQYTVMYTPESQPDQPYPWAVPEDMGSAWPAERRCNTISQRLEQYRPDGLLELQTAVENGYNTVCVTTQAVPGCRIVFTVPPGQDPVVTRDRVFENLTLADSGTATQGVNTFAEGDRSILTQVQSVLGLPTNGAAATPSGINLRPFLDVADGGTGTRLSAGQAAPARPLNPDNFR